MQWHPSHHHKINNPIEFCNPNPQSHALSQSNTQLHATHLDIASVLSNVDISAVRRKMRESNFPSDVHSLCSTRLSWLPGPALCTTSTFVNESNQLAQTLHLPNNLRHEAVAISPQVPGRADLTKLCCGCDAAEGCKSSHDCDCLHFICSADATDSLLCSEWTIGLNETQV